MKEIRLLEDMLIIDEYGDYYGVRPPSAIEIKNKINEIITTLNLIIKEENKNDHTRKSY